MQKQLADNLAKTEYGDMLLKMIQAIRQAIESHTQSQLYTKGTYPNCDQAAQNLTKFLAANPCPLYNELRDALEKACKMSEGNWSNGKLFNIELRNILDNSFSLKKFHEILERQFVRDISQSREDLATLHEQNDQMKAVAIEARVRIAQLEEQLNGLVTLAQEKQARIESLESEKQGNGGQLAEQVLNLTTLMGRIASQNNQKPNSSMASDSHVRLLDKRDLTASELKCCDYISITRLSAIKLLAEFHKKYERLLQDPSSSATSGPVFDETRKAIKSCIEARNCIKVLTACDDMLTIKIADRFLGQYLTNPEVSEGFISCIKEMSTLPADNERPDPKEKLNRFKYVILLFKEGEYLANADIYKLLNKARDEAKQNSNPVASTPAPAPK